MGKSTLTPEAGNYIYKVIKEVTQCCPEVIDIYEKGKKVGFNRHVEILVRRLAAGNQDAMDQLYPLVTPYILRTIFKVTSDAREWDAAVDILQAVCITISNTAHTLDDPTTSVAWIGRITRNKTLDLMRQRQRNLKRLEYMDAAENPEKYENVKDQVMRSPKDVENRMVLEAALSQLSPRDRYIVLQVGMYGMQLNEVAQELDMYLNTVKVAYSRARAKLRDILGDRSNYDF